MSSGSGNREAEREVEARLADLLLRVIDWLKFAEAKNTAAVGLSSTALGVIVTFLVAGPPVPELAGVGLSIGAVLLMVSLMLAVISFLPSTDLEKLLIGAREAPTANDNLLFYGHIARYEPKALARAIAETYFGHTGDIAEPSRFAVDLAGQIVTNARITVRKLKFFTWSLQLFAAGVLIASAAMAGTAVMHRDDPPACPAPPAAVCCDPRAAGACATPAAARYAAPRNALANAAMVSVAVETMV